MGLKQLIHAIRLTNFLLVSYALVDWIVEQYQIFNSLFIPLVMITSAILHLAEVVAVRWQRDMTNQL